jgi:hypothetical protein
MEDEIIKIKKSKTVKVKIVKASQDNATVEFTLGGILQRAIIPTNRIEDNKAPEDILSVGIPYGIPWELVQLKASSIELANALRMQEIWTYDDAMNNPNKIISALQAVYGVDLAALLQYARQNK